MSEREWLYPHPTHELNERRSRLLPQTDLGFRAFSKSVFAEGALGAHSVLALDVVARHEAAESVTPENEAIEAAGAPDGSSR